MFKNMKTQEEERQNVIDMVDKIIKAIFVKFDRRIADVVMESKTKEDLIKSLQSTRKAMHTIEEEVSEFLQQEKDLNV